MGKDIVPELLQAIGDKFNDRTTKILKDKLQLISDKKATHKDSNELAIEVGNILADIFGEEINSDILPDGKMYYNIAKRLIEPSLKADHEIISTYTADVQTMLNEQAGISLQGIKAEVNQDRIDNMVDRLADADSYDNIKWILDEPVKNYSQSVVDSTIKANADFQAKSGKPGKIIRREAGKCCKWCRDLAGSYKYGTEPRPNFYKRHAYCRCTIDYHPGNGKVQNSWSKKWRDEQAESEEIKERIELSEKDLQQKIIDKINAMDLSMATAQDVTELGKKINEKEKIFSVIGNHEELKKRLGKYRELGAEIPEESWAKGSNRQVKDQLIEAFSCYPKRWGEIAKDNNVKIVTRKTKRGFFAQGARKANGQYDNKFEDFRNGYVTIASNGSKRSTSFHEIGHFVEWHNPSVLRLEKEFIRQRTKDELEVALADIFPYGGYSRNEKTKKDNFISPYIGKYYSNGTEVLSMGLESMFEPGEGQIKSFDPQTFEVTRSKITDDEDYLNFIIGLFIKG